jgi:hypothetical protein
MKTPIDVLSGHGLVASRAQPDPQRPFLLFGERTWSLGEFQATVDHTAGMLAGRGIGKGDRMQSPIIWSNSGPPRCMIGQALPISPCPWTRQAMYELT